MPNKSSLRFGYLNFIDRSHCLLPGYCECHPYCKKTPCKNGEALMQKIPLKWFQNKCVLLHPENEWSLFHLFFKPQDMKRIKEYKTLFNVEGALELSDLKKTYRGLVKQWHPDKFQDDDDRKEEAQLMGQKVIDAYHFLVSMAPETKEKNLHEYKKTIDDCGIENYKHKGLLLEISFSEDEDAARVFPVTSSTN